jgi:hypothetical protein
VPTTNCTVFYDDGQEEDESEDDDDDADPDGHVPEEVNATATGADLAAKKKKISKRILGYTLKEDICLCQSLPAISQDAISGAEQKGRAYWKWVTIDYHEWRQLKPFKIHSDRGQVCIQK